MQFTPLFEKLRRHEDLTTEEAASAMGAIMDGEALPSQMAAFLMGLASKGERPAEMVGLARAMRARARAMPEVVAPVFDTCGTGGDGANTFNISTAVALVLAACGVRVAKHGNRAASSKCGTADVLEALGVDIEANADRVVRALKHAGIGFFFAQAWHPSMRHVGPTRKELGFRTAFNLLGPLTNPAGASRQLVGVPRSDLTELMARALGQLGSERAWVVHGADGLDEISTTGYTKVSEWINGAVRTFYLHPADAGIPVATIPDLRGGNAAENAVLMERLLAGERGPRRDIVLLNAGASLLIAGRAPDLVSGISLAAAAIDDGKVAATLSALRAQCGKAAS
jgi:anthranilate phosphoribosyltransferase